MTWQRQGHNFKKAYFGAEAVDDGAVALEDVEEEYWRVVDGGDRAVIVEYGSDLDTLAYASGFPGPDEPFGDHPWNLNVMPFTRGSVLDKAPGTITGVNRPWFYFGQVFSSFCWHVEDIFMASVNCTPPFLALVSQPVPCMGGVTCGGRGGVSFPLTSTRI